MVDEERRWMLWLGGALFTGSALYGSYTVGRHLGLVDEEDLDGEGAPGNGTAKPPTPTRTYQEETEIPTDTPVDTTETRTESLTGTATHTDSEPYVSEVEIYDLPKTWRVGRDLSVTAKANGAGLDYVAILENPEGMINKNVIAEESIEEDDVSEIELQTDGYEHNKEGLVDYQAIAKAGYDTDRSEKETVRFR